MQEIEINYATKGLSTQFSQLNFKIKDSLLEIVNAFHITMHRKVLLNQMQNNMSSFLPYSPLAL